MPYLQLTSTNRTTNQPTYLPTSQSHEAETKHIISSHDVGPTGFLFDLNSRDIFDDPTALLKSQLCRHQSSYTIKLYIFSGEITRFLWFSSGFPVAKNILVRRRGFVSAKTPPSVCLPGFGESQALETRGGNMGMMEVCWRYSYDFI